MKKILFLTIICLSLFTACGKKDIKNLPTLLPTDILSLEDAQSLVEDDYTLVMKNDAVIQEGNKTEVTYISEPLGDGDSVSVAVFTPDDTHTADDVRNEFLRSKDKRSDAIKVKGLGNGAYISYPSLHIYSNDVYIKITAGSGASETQAKLLVKYGKIAEKNLKNYFNQSHK